MMIVLTILLGIVYPLVMTGLAQVLFPCQANGSLVRDGSGKRDRLRADRAELHRSEVLPPASLGGGEGWLRRRRLRAAPTWGRPTRS